jgi:hypothetical protein
MNNNRVSFFVGPWTESIRQAVNRIATDTPKEKDVEYLVIFFAGKSTD